MTAKTTKMVLTVSFFVSGLLFLGFAGSQIVAPNPQLMVFAVVPFSALLASMVLLFTPDWDFLIAEEQDI